MNEDSITSTDTPPVAVIVEMRAAPAATVSLASAASSGLDGLRIDESYKPVQMAPAATAGFTVASQPEPTYLIRGEIDPERITELEANPNVVAVWKDTPIAGFIETAEAGALAATPAALSSCPIGSCDCSPSLPRGTIMDVARYLGVDQIWADGIRGQDIVVGVVDGGITASGRPINPLDKAAPGWPNKLVSNVIGGFPTTDWGTTGRAWGWHGNMCSTDVLGMAPEAKVYDLRISDASGGGTISNAIAAFDWAIAQFAENGTPQILTNSWGIFQEAWDPAYARNPNHPFTRKVVQALDAGILVLFAAGNCGGTCPDGRCGMDFGSGRSIWGANGHPRVMTVGAVNKNEDFVGYSSQGPAALDQKKPDFCSVTHFTGFFTSDSGTSAATPIAAGVVALMKQTKPALTQSDAKTALMNTAKDIGPAGWDIHSGAGIIRARAAQQAI